MARSFVAYETIPLISINLENTSQNPSFKPLPICLPNLKKPLFSLYIVCIHFFIYIFYTPLYIYLVYWDDTPLMTPHAFYNAPCFFRCILWMHITSPTMQLLNHISLWFAASNGIMKKWEITPCISQSFFKFSSKTFPRFLFSILTWRICLHGVFT